MHSKPELHILLTNILSSLLSCKINVFLCEFYDIAYKKLLA